MEIIELREQVRQTALRAYTEKLVAGTSGNVSAFNRRQGLMVITPSNMDYTIMKPSDLVVMKLDGSKVEGDLIPSSEWRLHAELYKNFDIANAVVHTHSPRASSFAVLHESIPLVLNEMLSFLGGDIPLADFALPGTAEVGLNAVKAMNSDKYLRYSCLLANHGAVAIGDDLNEAYKRAVYTEDAATVYHFARQLGKPVEIPADAITALREIYGLNK